MSASNEHGNSGSISNPVARQGSISDKLKKPDPNLIIACLEWAGQVLLSMDIKSPKPTEYRAYWPEYAQDPSEAYGYTGEKLRVAIPKASDIELMEDIYKWLTLIENKQPRQVVAIRSLVTPISERYVYPWTKIAITLHMDRRGVKRLHRQGIKDLEYKLDVINLERMVLAITG